MRSLDAYIRISTTMSADASTSYQMPPKPVWSFRYKFLRGRFCESAFAALIRKTYFTWFCRHRQWERVFELDIWPDDYHRTAYPSRPTFRMIVRHCPTCDRFFLKTDGNHHDLDSL